MKPTFFATPSTFRKWLDQHHDKTKELFVGFYKKSSNIPSVTWPESVDVALCFGWIDGVRRSLDESSYMIRFTPRKSKSTWSSINIKRVRVLTKMRLMHDAGLKAFNARSGEKSGIYAYEQRKGAQFTAAQEREFRAHKSAWTYFRFQAPWYQRTATWWVISAKREETRQKRLSILIKRSDRQQTLPQLTRWSKK